MSSLFVPIDVEIFRTGKKNDGNGAAITPDYCQIGETFLGEHIEQKPFKRNMRLEPGVHLHFILPDALTHAEQRDGKLEYPLIPTRWLVVRLEAKQKIDAACWVVESDYLGEDNTGSIPIPYLDNSGKCCRYLGRTYELGALPEPGGMRFPLTAVGPGDPTFAAFYPSCRSVLGFYDKLSNYSEGEFEFTYLVVGCYGNLANDPLHSLSDNEIIDYLKKNKWHLENANNLPKQLICHGMVHGVKWEGASKRYETGEPKGKVSAAIGNTSIEALSALIAHNYNAAANTNSHNLERILTALQYNLMDTLSGLDGISQMEDTIHKETFNPDNGGDIWRISQAEKSNSETAILPKELGVLLSDLNVLQQSIDGFKLEKRWLQNAIYACWHLHELHIENDEDSDPSQKRIEQEIAELITQLESLEENLQTKSTGLDEKKRVIEALLHSTHDTYFLERIPAGNFYTPLDPVVLLAGDGVNRPYAFGEDGFFREDGLLECRIETINGLTASERYLDRQKILEYFTSVPQIEQDDILNLICESVCLSPAIVNWIIKQSGIQGLEPSGPRPSQLGCRQWKQSWVTLFMEWKVDYAPTKANVSGKDNSMEGWTLGELEYSFGGTFPNVSVAQSGRNILTPHSTLQLRKSLEDYLKAHADEKLKEILNRISNLSVVSQRMGGLNLRFLSKHQVMQLPLMTVSKENKDKVLTAAVREKLNGLELYPEMASTRFLPIRSGFLKLGKISVCSTFAQSQELVSNLNSVIFSENLPMKKENWGEIPPRLVQGSRISFEFISSDNKRIKSGLPKSTSPICGYVVPDILNMNLFVFDAEGIWLGMLRSVLEKGKIFGVWMNAPGKTKNDFSNEHLKDFVEGIEAYRSKKDAAFGAFLQLLDQRLSHTLNKETGDSLASIWGRPIALVRASVNLQLMGKPAYSMASSNFGKYQTDKFEKINYPILIGDAARLRDGVIGYFCDINQSKQYSGYSKLICAPHTDKPKIDTEYLEYEKKAALSSDDAEPTYISLLLEPGASVSVRSGILPAISESLLPEHFQPVLSKLYLSLEMNPIITELTDTSEVFIPLPKESDGEWSWSHLISNGQYTEHTILPPEDSFHDRKPYVVDGYLIRKLPK